MIVGIFHIPFTMKSLTLDVRLGLILLGMLRTWTKGWPKQQ